MNPLIQNPVLQQPIFLQQPGPPRPGMSLIPEPQIIPQQIPTTDQNVSNEQQKKEIAVQLLDPNNTLYINHLNEKVPLDELKTELQTMFQKYGKILQITAKRNIHMRGQAFIVFDKVSEAEKALQALQGLMFYGKKIQINYAKIKSDVISKRDGSYVKRDKVKPSLEEIIKKPQKKIKLNPEQPQQQKAQNPVVKQPVQRNIIIPNNILFLENLPETITENVLQSYFVPYGGFKEVRLIQSKRVAFAEFEDEFQAGMACSELAGKKIAPDYNLQISYAKK